MLCITRKSFVNRHSLGYRTGLLYQNKLLWRKLIKEEENINELIKELTELSKKEKRVKQKLHCVDDIKQAVHQFIDWINTIPDIVIDRLCI